MECYECKQERTKWNLVSVPNPKRLHHEVTLFELSIFPNNEVKYHAGRKGEVRWCTYHKILWCTQKLKIHPLQLHVHVSLIGIGKIVLCYVFSTTTMKYVIANLQVGTGVKSIASYISITSVCNQQSLITPVASRRNLSVVTK